MMDDESLTLTVPDNDTVPQCVAVPLGVGEGEEHTVAVAETDTEPLTVPHPLPEKDALGDPDGEGVVLTQLDAVPEVQGVAEPLKVTDTVAVTEGLAEVETEPLTDRHPLPE